MVGEEYDSGSSWDWAAKGPMLLVDAYHTTVVSLLATKISQYFFWQNHFRLSLIHTGLYYFYSVLSIWLTTTRVQTTNFNLKRTTTTTVSWEWECYRCASSLVRMPILLGSPVMSATRQGSLPMWVRYNRAMMSRCTGQWKVIHLQAPDWYNGTMVSSSVKDVEP